MFTYQIAVSLIQDIFMQLIKPSEISSKIMTLIEESDEFVILVSPYVKISKWIKMVKKIETLKVRNIPFEFFIRDDKTNQTSVDELNELEYKYTAIPNLHCKLYINEKYAIVTSMNLLLSSEINSLEIGYMTETKAEYTELMDYYKRYLSVKIEEVAKVAEIKHTKDWRDCIGETLSNQITGQILVNKDEGHLTINIDTFIYKCFIWNSKGNRLRMSTILTPEEFDVIGRYLDEFQVKTGLEFELSNGGNRYPNTIFATLGVKLRSTYIDDVLSQEQLVVADKIVEFVTLLNNFKANNGRATDTQVPVKKYSDFLIEWKHYLTNSYQQTLFTVDDDIIQAKDFPVKNVDFSTRYGFVNLTFKADYNYMKRLKEMEKNRLHKLLSDYRLFWSSANQISIYTAKDREYNDVEYCAKGLETIIAEVKRMQLS